MRKSPRDRRLSADYQSVEQLQADSSIFSFIGRGNPPQRYVLKFAGAGFRRNSAGKIVVCEQHEVIVELGAAYPRMVPNLAWQSPIFHPNISNNGVVCLGGYGTHWVPSLTLSEMCTMLWDMIRYKNFDSESPYNREAALWSKHQTDFKFPIDRRSIRDLISGEKLAPVTPDIVVVNKTGDVANRASVALHNMTEEIEIIETGIEIVERHDRDRASDDGIFYIG